jgi:hypothetical protein
MNSQQLDPAGRAVRSWCFMPARGLVLGDMLLAQKIALETMEQEALASRIARFAPSPSSPVDANHVACDCRFYPKGLLGPEHVDP